MAGPKYDVVVLSDSPVAYWPLDESEVGDGTELLDVVDGRIAIARGDWRPGQGPTTQTAGGLQSLDFENAWLDAGTDRLIGTTPGVSVELWARLRQPPAWQMFLEGPWQPGQGWLAGVADNPAPWALTYWTDWKLIAPMSDAGVGTARDAVSPGSWRHIVLTAGATGSRIYVDGILVVEQTGDPYAGAEDDQFMVKTLAGAPLLGELPLTQVSRVAFYGHELTSARVVAHYNARFGTEDTLLPAQNTAFDNAVVADGASHYWRLDESSVDAGDAAGDSVGFLTGIYRGVVTLADGPTSSINKAVRLGGAGNGYVELTGARLFFGVTAWSWEFWALTDPANVSEIILGLATQPGDHPLWWVGQMPDGRFLCSARLSHNFTPSAYTRGSWHHVVHTWDGGAQKLYLDGVDSGIASSGGAAMVEDLGVLKVGGRNWRDNLYFQGLLARVAYYPLALSSAQVADHWDKRDTVAAPVDLRDGAMALGRAWLGSNGQLHTLADLLYYLLGAPVEL